MMSTPTLTPYDTGARCEPRPWQPDHPSVISAMRTGEAEHIGKVDFDDDTNETVVTVFVAKDPGTGRHVVHVIPFVDDADLEIRLHEEPIV